MKMNRIRLLAVSFFMILQVGCSPMTTNSEDFNGYGYSRWGSNTYTIMNAPTHTLNESDSKCITKTKSISIDDEIKNKTTTECVEVNNLHSDKSKVFREILNSFFNSGTGMMFISGLLELL